MTGKKNSTARIPAELWSMKQLYLEFAKKLKQSNTTTTPTTLWRGNVWIDGKLFTSEMFPRLHLFLRAYYPWLVQKQQGIMWTWVLVPLCAASLMVSRPSERLYGWSRVSFVKAPEASSVLPFSDISRTNEIRLYVTMEVVKIVLIIDGYQHNHDQCLLLIFFSTLLLKTEQNMKCGGEIVLIFPFVCWESLADSI